MKKLLAIACLTGLLSACSPAEMIVNVWSEDGSGSVKQALTVAKCESDLNPLSLKDNSKSTDIGIFRIGVVDAKRFGWNVTEEDLYDPWTNIVIAHDIWKNIGWRIWSCRVRL